MTIALDPASFYDMNFFMDNVRFRLHRTELLQAVVRCVETSDQNMSFEPIRIRPVSLRIPAPTEFELRHVSDEPACGQVVFPRARPLSLEEGALSSALLLTSPSQSASACFSGSISEPSSEFNSEQSSLFPFSISEPLSETTTSSWFDAVSEPTVSSGEESQASMTATGDSGEDARTAEVSTPTWESFMSPALVVSDVSGSSAGSSVFLVSDVSPSSRGRVSSGAASSVLSVSGTGSEWSGAAERRRRRPI
jgi:hypothetical protein